MTRYASLSWFRAVCPYRLTLCGLLLCVLILPSHRSAHAQQVIATVVTGLRPGQVAVNTKTNKIYVNSPSSAIYPGGNNSVTVIDGVTNQPSTIGGLANPTFIDVNPATNKIYVGSNRNYWSLAGIVTVIDGATNAKVDIPVGKGLSALAVNPVTNKIYVANSTDNNVMVIDGSTNAVTTVATGQNPIALAVNTVTNKIYVVNYLSSTVTVIDGKTNSTASVKVGYYPWKIAVNSVTNKIYVIPSYPTGFNVVISVIDGATNTPAEIVLGDASKGAMPPNDLAVNAVTNKIYAVNFYDGSDTSHGIVTVVDGVTKALSTVVAGLLPITLAVDSATNQVYVANNSSNDVTVIDGATNKTTTVSVGQEPASLALNAVTHKAYVANRKDGTVSVISGSGKATNSTTTTVMADVNPQQAGTKVTFTAHVAAASGSASPTGSLTFSVDTINQPALTLDSSGHAIFATSTLVAGAHTIRASYAGTSTFGASSGSLIETINAVPASAPTFKPSAGTYYAPQSVMLWTAMPANATIYYTLNGTTPTTSSTRYTAPISISKTTTIKAIATGAGYTPSTVATGLFTIAIGAPAFSPAPGPYYGPQLLTLTDATPGAAIYYTLDGPTPTTASTKYVGPIQVTKTATVKAIAFSSAYGTSAMTTGLFTIYPPHATTPAFSIRAGTYTTTQWVTLSKGTAAETIYYTTNGLTPTTASIKYTGPITVSASLTINAIAVAAGYSQSLLATAAYTITPPAWAPTFSLTAGAYKGTQTIRIGDTAPGAIIFYTMNGATPTNSSTRYTGPIAIGATATIKAIATAAGYAPSPVAAATYTITP